MLLLFHPNHPDHISMYLMIFLLVVLLMIIVVMVTTVIQQLYITHKPIVIPIKKFDNDESLLIKPPTEIIIEGNQHECHKQLTPCVSHIDCDKCREGLANCQYFDEQTVIMLVDPNTNKEVQHIIQPGESYCMALDRERARSCNPNTGIWLLAESATGYTLLCTCLQPGLVTQLNLYEDCNISVGCQPNGHIFDINEHPLRCLCEEGFVADYNNTTETPFCRPLKVRDVVYNEDFFPRAPCADGMVRIDHPALADTYRRELRLGDICVADPCSVDPVSGQRTAGRLQYYHNEKDKIEYKYCHCPIGRNLFPVHSNLPSMIGESTRPVVNACIMPFNTHILNIPRIDYRVFWGRDDEYVSDDEIVAVVNKDVNVMSHQRYENLLKPLLRRNPQSIDVPFEKSLVFKVSTAHQVFILERVSDNISERSLFEQYVAIASRTERPCFGIRSSASRCINDSSFKCINRYPGSTVWLAETLNNAWCVISRQGWAIRIWSSPTRYPRGQFPMVFNFDIKFVYEMPDIRFSFMTITTGVNVTDDVDNLVVLMTTYKNYTVD